ncbi:MAG: hypothetical protein JW913_19720 [Chitinispirillaceae bacterium]|nr:hypothetical protein [Chitinispirillaceae bacterium]
MEKGVSFLQPVLPLESIAALPGNYARAANRWFLAVFVFFTLVFSEDEVEITANPSKMAYAPSDTVIIALKVHLPPEYVLYGNPKGPGVGRPVAISIACDDPGVRWLAVKKLKAEKYGPSFGEWVWVYRNETFFFCTGVIASEYNGENQTCKGSIIFEGLLCRDACRMLVKLVPFLFTIAVKDRAADRFGAFADIQPKYKSAAWMMDLQPVPEKYGSDKEPLHDTRLRWKRLLD